MCCTTKTEMEVRNFGSEFGTRQGEAEMVVPAKATPHETKKLSDIDDQEGLRFHIPLLMFFTNNNNSDDDEPAKVIKEAIREALVHYYPLAGRLREGGDDRKLVVECNGEGVLFVESHADVSLMELGDSILPPCPYLDHFLLPLPASQHILGCPLLFFQVTRLTCGGFVLGIRMNHTVCDTLGLFQFLKMVSEIATHSPISQFPVWHRHLLSARHPPRITCLHHEFLQPTSHHPNPQHTSHSDPDTQTAHKSFFFGAKHIASLRNRLPTHLRNCSAFELVTACLWRCRTEALDLNPSEVVAISLVITAQGKQGLDLPYGYYGNAFAFPAAISEAGLICKNPLGYALGLIRRAKARMSKEYLSSVADLMVLKGRPMYRRDGNYLVADTTRVGFHKLDFGWGKPVYGGIGGAIPYVSFYAAFRSSKGENGVLVPTLLPRKAMNRFLSLVERMTSGDGKVVDGNYNDGTTMMGTLSKL